MQLEDKPDLVTWNRDNQSAPAVRILWNIDNSTQSLVIVSVLRFMCSTNDDAANIVSATNY